MMPFHKGARGEDIEIDRCWAFLDSQDNSDDSFKFVFH